MTMAMGHDGKTKLVFLICWPLLHEPPRIRRILLLLVCSTERSFCGLTNTEQPTIDASPTDCTSNTMGQGVCVTKTHHIDINR